MAVIELVRESVEESRKANAKSAAPAKKAPAKKAPAKSAPARLRLRCGNSGAGGRSCRCSRSAAESPAEPSPAEKLVDETSELEDATAEQEQPSDDSSAEEAVAASEPDETSEADEKA